MFQVITQSRLRLTPLVVVDGIEFWDILDLPLYVSHQGDFYHMVQDGDRLDTIADNYYGNPNLWWVLAWANDLEIVQTQMNRGATLVVPSQDYVANQLFPVSSSRRTR